MDGAQLSFYDHRCRTGRGGPRPGAGRPRKRQSNRRPSHAARPRHSRYVPVHATLRVGRGLPSLRRKRYLAELRRSLRALQSRAGFRVCHYSVQRDHLHLIVEADDGAALASGMKALGARVARAANRAFGRIGTVLAERCHLRALRTPAEVRAALAYVLLNARKHAWQHIRCAPRAALDIASSGLFFDGWSRPPEAFDDESGRRPKDVSRAESWLLRIGWRIHHSLIDPDEVPGR